MKGFLNDDWLTRHDAEVRTKVIDEFANKVKTLRYRVSKDGGETFYITQEFCDRDIDEIVEQLKLRK